jgi:WD40 repeat protein
MGSVVSGQEFEALDHGLQAVAPALKHHLAPTPEAVQGLAHATMAGVYRLFQLKHKFRLETAAFSPDGDWVVTAGWNRDIMIWDARTGLLRYQVQVLSTGIVEPRVWAAEFSTNGRYLVTLGNDRTAHIWEFATLFSLDPHPVWSLPCGEQPVSKAAVCFSYSGLYLAASGRSGDSYCAKVWKIPAGATDSTPTEVSTLKHAGEIESLDFNDKKADSQERYLAVAGSENPSVRIFDFLSKEEVFPYRPVKPDNAVPAKAGGARHALFAYWNDSVYSAGDDGTIQTWGWNKALGPSPAAEGVYRNYIAHEGTVSSLAASGDGRLMASAGLRDYRGQIWSREYSAHPLYTLTSHTAQITSVRFSNDYHHLVTASYDKTAEIWLLASPFYCGSASTLDFLAPSPDGSTIAAPSAAGRVLIWQTAWKGIGMNDSDRSPWNIIGQTSETHFPGPVFHAAYSPDGKQLATGAEHGDIRIWQLLDKGRLTGPYLRLKRQTDKNVNCVAFSPDGRSLLSASDDHIISLWDVRTGKITRTFQHPDKVYSCAFSPDGKQVLTGCADGVSRLFDVTGNPLRTMQLPGPRGRAAQNYP